MPIKDVSQLINRADDLFSSPERHNNERLWEELTEFMLNNQYGHFTSSTATQTDLSGITSSQAGAKKTTRVYDSTALQAVQDLAASFQGTLTNPATTWSKIRFQNEALNDNDEAIRWLEEVNNRIHAQLNESNFDTEIGKAYQSLVALANMAIFQELDENNNMIFTCVHLGQIAWMSNKNDIVDTVFRKFDLNAMQAYEKWGDKVHDKIKKALEESPYKEFSFMQCVFPRDPKDIKLNELGLAPGENRPFANVYVDMTHNVIIDETGYYEFPLHVARWSLMPGERYGRGPSHLALPDVRTLNRLKMRGLEAIDLQVRPPIFANQRDIFGSLNMRPGGISVVKNIQGIREFVSQARSDILQFSVEELRNSIRSVFFLDKLLLPPREDTGEMTAFEVGQRVEQMHRVLGPTLSRLNSELLQPLIIRTFKLLLRSGSLPEIPDVVLENGADVEIVFVNQLARAQQIQDVNTIQQVYQQAAFMAQVDPTVLDNLNSDEAVRSIARVIGSPEAIMRSREEVEQVREQRAQAQQQQMAMEQANLAADTAAKAGMTGNNTNNQ